MESNPASRSKKQSDSFFRLLSCPVEAYPIVESVLLSITNKTGGSISDLNIVFTPDTRQINVESFKGVLDITYQKHEGFKYKKKTQTSYYIRKC